MILNEQTSNVLGDPWLSRNTPVKTMYSTEGAKSITLLSVPPPYYFSVNSVRKNNFKGFLFPLTTIWWKLPKPHLQRVVIIKQNPFAGELKAFPVLICDLKNRRHFRVLKLQTKPCLISKVPGLLMHQYFKDGKINCFFKNIGSSIQHYGRYIRFTKYEISSGQLV